jgi:uncharacterized repeat protein (TIGR01451 family)
VWVSPTEDAFLFIDYNNSGSRTGYDIRQVRQLESVRIRNPYTKDMSGALIFARKWDRNNASQTIATASVDWPEVDIASAWGQDPNVSDPDQDISLDLGTVVLPFKSIFVSKWASSNPIVPGQRLTYTIRVINVGQSNIRAGKFWIVDPILDQAQYVPGTTTYSRDLGVTKVPVPDSSSGTPFPLDGQGITNMYDLNRRGDAHDISFDVIIDSDALVRTTVVNKGYINEPGRPRLPFSTETPLLLSSGVDIDNKVMILQQNTFLCFVCFFILHHDILTYVFAHFNERYTLVIMVVLVAILQFHKKW